MSKNEEQKADQILCCQNSYQLKIFEKVDADDGEKIMIMQQVLEQKFEQNDEFRNAIFETNKRQILIAGTDLFWNVGFSYRYACVSDPLEYPGANNLGILLVNMRDHK